MTTTRRPRSWKKGHRACKPRWWKSSGSKTPGIFWPSRLPRSSSSAWWKSSCPSCAISFWMLYTFSMGTPDIRYARPEDTREMADLTVAAWQTAYSGIIDPAYVATRKTNDYAGKFQAMLERGEDKILVAELDGRVAGYAAGAPLLSGGYDCETRGLYVHPEYQGQGI